MINRFKKFLQFVLVIWLIATNSCSVFAAESKTDSKSTNSLTIQDITSNLKTIDEFTHQTENEYFTLQLSQKGQSPFTGEVTYELLITPHLTSKDTQILWIVPSTIEITSQNNIFQPMQEEYTYKVQDKFKLLKEGTYQITAQVVSWQHDTNYANSISDTIIASDELLAQPVSTSYKLQLALKYALIFLGIAGSVVLVYFLVKKNFWKIKDWFTPPY